MIWAKLAKFSLERAKFYGEHEEHIYRDKNSVGVVTLQAWSQSENTNSDNEYQLLGLKYTKLRFLSFQDTGPHQSICGRYSKMPTNRNSCQVAATLSGAKDGWDPPSTTSIFCKVDVLISVLGCWMVRKMFLLITHMTQLLG